MPLFLIFIVIPIIELTVILQVSGAIGVLWTVLLILMTAMIGVTLLRQQGLATLMRAGQKMQQGQLPAQELAEGFLLALAGALLLTPGFVTDALGFSLLVPSVRKVLVKSVIKLLQPRMMSNMGGGFSQTFEQKTYTGTSRDETGRRQQETIIEGEFKRED